MPTYYFYILDRQDHITARRDVESPSSLEAVRVARRLLSEDPLHSPAIEIWEATRRLQRVDRHTAG